MARSPLSTRNLHPHYPAQALHQAWHYAYYLVLCDPTLGSMPLRYWRAPTCAITGALQLASDSAGRSTQFAPNCVASLSRPDDLLQTCWRFNFGYQCFTQLPLPMTSTDWGFVATNSRCSQYLFLWAQFWGNFGLHVLRICFHWNTYTPFWIAFSTIAVFYLGRLSWCQPVWLNCL